MKRETVQSIFRFLLNTLTHYEFIGEENIPRQGGVIVALNHMSQVDSVLMASVPSRPDITALVADKYRNYLFFRYVLDSIGIIWLDREKADFSAFRLGAEALKQGRALGIAPEGTRSPNYQLLPGKPGALLLAARTGVPIVPVGISGTEDGIRRALLLKKPHFVARFGKPYIMPPLERDNRDEVLQKATDEVMCRIAALLPESYWGYYANHPRLKELLAEQNGKSS